MKITDKITITNEDNMELMARYPDNYFDLAIVDPPYGIDAAKMQRGNSKIKPDKTKNWDNKIPNDSYLKELFRVSKNQVIWGGDYFNLPPSQYFCIWDKGETMYGRDFAEAEFAWIRSGGTRIFKKTPNQLDRIHPTQKPVRLYEWLLKNYAVCKTCGDEGGYYEDVAGDGGSKMYMDCPDCGGEKAKILDTHLGSGSIAIACHNYKYELTACELDKDYYDAAIKRIKTHVKQLQLF